MLTCCITLISILSKYIIFFRKVNFVVLIKKYLTQIHTNIIKFTKLLLKNILVSINVDQNLNKCVNNFIIVIFNHIFC